MNNSYLLGASLAVALFVGAANATAAEELKSGPQKATIKVNAFNPLHCSGNSVGSKSCLV